MLAIRAARVFDGEQFTSGGATLLIDGRRITAVEQGFPDLPDGCEVIDARAGTALPGLIDTHVHLVTDSRERALDRVAGYSDGEIDEVITDALRCHLDAGVTTVRDLGDRRFVVVDRRDRQRSAPIDVAEPTVLASGPPITSPGGHCHYLGGEVSGQSEIAAAIRERVERKVDIVKVMASGGMNTFGTDVMRPQFTPPDLHYLVDQAHAAGLPVTAHAHALAAVELAIECGVDGIEHCTCLTPNGPVLTDELIADLASLGIVIGGALFAPPPAVDATVPANVRAMMEKAGITPESVRALVLHHRGRMYHGGVRLVAGSDAGIGPAMAHGLIREAVKFYVETGAPIPTAVAAATSLAAEACAVGDRKGLLRRGYDADVLIVDGDLRSDVGVLANVRAVVLGGAVVR